MISWNLASICTLGLSFMDSYVFNGNGWTVWQYFIATSIFAIYLNGLNK